MMKAIGFAIILSLSALAFAGPNASHWSLRYLARASNSLLVASNQSLDKQKVVCQIPSQKISELSQNLKALVDVKISKLNDKQKTEIRLHSLTCVDECSCDIFSYYLEQSTDPKDKEALGRMNPAADKISTEARLTCAQKFPEFCKSLLLKTISK